MDYRPRETSQRPADRDPPGKPQVVAISNRPIYQTVAYFSLMFFLISLGFSLYQGRPLPDAVLIALVTSFVTLCPWWVHYRICGRNEGIVFWFIFQGSCANNWNRLPTLDVLAALAAWTGFNCAFVAAWATWRRPRPKTKATHRQALWDAEVDGPE